MNRVLALIAMFSIFSAFADGTGFADRVKEGIEPTGLHWATLIIIIIIMIFAIITVVKSLFKK